MIHGSNHPRTARSAPGQDTGGRSPFPALIFLQGGKHCARLITTRNDTVLPPDAQRISVDAMRLEEAVQLLCAGLDDIARSANDMKALRQLAVRLDGWPLLLKLVNQVLREQVNYGKALVLATWNIRSG